MRPILECIGHLEGYKDKWSPKAYNSDSQEIFVKRLDQNLRNCSLRSRTRDWFEAFHSSEVTLLNLMTKSAWPPMKSLSSLVESRKTTKRHKAWPVVIVRARLLRQMQTRKRKDLYWGKSTFSKSLRILELTLGTSRCLVINWLRSASIFVGQITVNGWQIS